MVTRTISIRDNTPYEEVIAIKREWQYPLYTHPEFYFDIAVFELGKEIKERKYLPINLSMNQISLFFRKKNYL